MADEYINKSELLFEMATSLIPQDMDTIRGYAIAKDLIRNAPTADVKPVVHGEWIMDEYTHRYRCSVCQAFQPYDTVISYGEEYIDYWDCNYCPDCGAIMREGNSNE